VAAPKKSPLFPEWDYLIITASNDKQAGVYRSLIGLRQSLGLISGVKSVLVVADPGGRRVGSGGSTVHCLLQVLNLEMRTKRELKARLDPKTWEEALARLRILIVHAGGDSRRLPPYGPCGKIFIPVPGEEGGAAGTTIFDRLVPTYLELPRPDGGGGQVVVASGDVLLNFEAADIVFAQRGVTGVGALVSPDVAKNHGVYCRHEDGGVRMFLQKPPVAKQVEAGAIDSHGQAVLDIGILNFDPSAAVRLLKLCGAGAGQDRKSGRKLVWGGPLAESIEAAGLDIYREICCALGKDTSYAGYVDEVRGAGSGVEGRALWSIYRGLKPVPFHVHVVPRFRFLHFGTLQDLIESGRSLVSSDMGDSEKGTSVVVNSRVSGAGIIHGKNAWVEGCRVEAPLTLGGENVVVGVDVEAPLALPRGGCLDIIEGRGRDGRKGWFVRIYAVDDAFHIAVDKGARLGGIPLREWLGAMGAGPEGVWDAKLPEGERTVWNGRFFPSIRKREDWRSWTWMSEPRKASAEQRAGWLAARRYSLEEIAVRADLDEFLERRLKIRGGEIREKLYRAFSPEGGLSAGEIFYLVRNTEKDGQARWIVAIVREAIRSYEAARTRQGLESLEFSRIIHTLGSVLEKAAGEGGGAREGDGGTRRKEGSGARGNHKDPWDIAGALRAGLTDAEKKCLGSLGLPIEGAAKLKNWAGQMKEAAFRHLSRTIVYRSGGVQAPPRNVLRSDEIVWGRAPARLDLGGGWTDTPPYSLERGGCVINAAVDLNGQAPIQAYARVIDEREIRINSIDHSRRVVIRELDELLDYREPASQFALAKAALALAGFAVGAAAGTGAGAGAGAAAAWKDSGEAARRGGRAAGPGGGGRARTLEDMLKHFGGGIELTTLAAIPSGSGLGTSSIMGAVLMSIIGRMVGRPLAERELFHAVLKLEQELTTGGGWQDQIGGVVPGVKVISAERGLVPDPRIHFVPADVLDPATNGGRTLLYYTGLRRLAKNILHDVVGRYLDRDRAAMETLGRLHAFPPLMAEAMGMKDMERFGALIDAAWRLNVDLDLDHTTPVIEELRARVGKHVLGAKLLGAGGGGFLLMVCRSADDAAAVRRMLEREPPNDRARFFDFSINKTGLVVTVC
jgi:galactokinase/mevalonate kinase-like predicted kinase